MANREFDALFYSIDRNHEIQYRVLFTRSPAANGDASKRQDRRFGDDFISSNRA